MLPSSKEGGVSLALDYHGTPAEQLEKLFKDCGVSPDKVCHRIERSDPPIEAADFALSCRYLIQQLRHHPRFPPPQQILDLHRLRWEEGREMAMGWDHG
jgi:hypothetical protein